MTPAFWLCLLLVIASGLSAYIGNEWGRKLGKRKLSIFRMRPKHSSTFVTILLSMCLSLGLMGALFTLIPGLQTAFFMPTNGDAEQEAFTHYENALQIANARLQHLSQEERTATQQSRSEGSPDIRSNSSSDLPAEKFALAIDTPTAVQTEAATALTPKQATQPRQNQVSGTAKREAPVKPLNIKPQLQPQRVSESRLEGRHIKRSPSPVPPPLVASLPERTEAVETSSAPTNLSPVVSAREVRVATAPKAINYPKGTLFELTVNGELSDAESTQLRQGIQRLTKDYLSLLGIQEEALQFKNAQIQQEMVKLSASGQYRLHIALSPSQSTEIPVDVSVSMVNGATTMAEGEAFDPQRLLEEQRLQSNSTRQSLQQDLQAVLKKHAQQQQVALKLSPQPLKPTRSVQLPFEILNIVNQNGVIRGELFLR